jgi:hypothetical protein
LIYVKISGVIAIPASLASDFIHIAGKPIHIAPEYTIHIIGIAIEHSFNGCFKRAAVAG